MLVVGLCLILTVLLADDVTTQTYFVVQINTNKDAVTKSQADLEGQLAFVEGLVKEANSDTSLDAIKVCPVCLGSLCVDCSLVVL